MQMKVKIFTCRFGAGHMKGALYLKESWKNHDVEIVDIIQEMFPEKADFIYKTYGAWAKQARYLNRMVTGEGAHNLAYHFLDPLRDRFCQMMDRYRGADVYVATYSAAAHLLNYYKKTYFDQTPFITMITDFTPHEGWIQESTDAYLVVSDYTKSSMLSLGIEDKKVHLYGWPKQYVQHPSRRGPLHILVAGGGLGLLPENKKFYQDLRDRQGAKIRVLCGKNKKLYQKIKSWQLRDVSPYPFLSSLDKHYQWADLCITKPGGMSILEALYWELPICYIKPYLSQEVRNARYLESIQGGFLLERKMPVLTRRQLVDYRIHLRDNRITGMPDLVDLVASTYHGPRTPFMEGPGREKYLGKIHPAYHAG